MGPPQTLPPQQRSNALPFGLVPHRLAATTPPALPCASLATPPTPPLPPPPGDAARCQPRRGGGQVLLPLPGGAPSPRPVPPDAAPLAGGPGVPVVGVSLPRLCRPGRTSCGRPPGHGATPAAWGGVAVLLFPIFTPLSPPATHHEARLGGEGSSTSQRCRLESSVPTQVQAGSCCLTAATDARPAPPRRDPPVGRFVPPPR